MDQPLQLQFWCDKTRRYVPTEHKPDADFARSFYRAWRIARTGRALKPAYRVPQFTGSARDVATVQRHYLQWAEQKGLKSVTAYRERPPLNVMLAKPIFSGEIRYITAAEHFAVTESQEEQCVIGETNMTAHPITCACNACKRAQEILKSIYDDLARIDELQQGIQTDCAELADIHGTDAPVFNDTREAWEYLSERIGAEHSHLLTDVTTYLWKSQELRRSNR